MLGFKSEREQLLEARKENAALKAAQARTEADLVYLAMMTDVEIEEEAEEGEAEEDE